MLNNKYIVAAIITIEKITPNTFPILLCSLFFHNKKSPLYGKYNTTNTESFELHGTLAIKNLFHCFK